MPKQGIELGTFCSRERRLNHSATAPHQKLNQSYCMERYGNKDYEYYLQHATMANQSMRLERKDIMTYI